MAKSKKAIKRAILGDRLRGVDRILIFRFFRLLHGRFWGLGALFSFVIGAAIGYSIRPDLLRVEIPLSQLGSDVRTAPFFAGSMFFAAYSLWRWRVYLRRTLKNSRPVVPLVSLTILGLYIIALMPMTWDVWPSRLHDFGVGLTGVSMLATVLVDSILSKNRKNSKATFWKTIKGLSFVTILLGGITVLLSVEWVDKLELMLLGEGVMFVGYSMWVILKIYVGEGTQSAVGRIVKKLLNKMTNIDKCDII